MGNFEKCTVAMLGGPCSQHVTGNTSRQNQPQSAIMHDHHLYTAVVPYRILYYNDKQLSESMMIILLAHIFYWRIYAPLGLNEVKSKWTVPEDANMAID